MLAGYRFERLSKENIHDLVSVYRNAFGKEISVEYLHKKQDTSFAGPSYVGYIAYSEQGEPAAFYGVFPCEIMYNGSTYLAAQSGDTMTHSEHSGKGLFVALAKKTYELCRQLNIHFVFGFPNENSYPGFVKKLDWTHEKDMQPYIVRVKTLSWLRIKNITKLPLSFHRCWCRFIIGLQPKGQAFENSVSNENVGGIYRDKRFFSYKTYENNYIVNLGGVNVWLKPSEEYLLIGDIEKCSGEQFHKTIGRLKRMAFFMGQHHLRYQCSPGAFHRDSFLQIGQMLGMKYAVGGVNFSGLVPLANLEFTMCDNDSF